MAVKRVLIVPAKWALAERLRADGHIVVEADTAEDAGERVDAGIDAVVIDLLMPGRAAFAVLEAVRERDPDPPVIVTAQAGDIEGAITEALGAGAFDYALEPVNIDEIARRVISAFEVTRIRRELRTLRDRLARPFTLASLIGASPAMQFARDVARRVSEADAPVLVTGERGTGKDHIARVLHYTGTRAMGPFLKVQCGGVSEEELDVTLFGHEPLTGWGSFLVRGVFDEAHDGSIFLDDVGALTPALQSKLLRYLESGDFKRVGDSPDIRVDVRVIAASDRPLQAEVAAGRFRSDLFYRLNVFAIELPALTARRGDIPLLVRHFLEQRNRRGGRKIAGVTDAALAAMSSYRWPGNLDELRSVIDRAAMLAASDHIDITDLAGLGTAFAEQTRARAAGDVPFAEARIDEGRMAAPHAAQTAAGAAPSTDAASSAGARSKTSPAAMTARARSKPTRPFELPEDGCDLDAVEKSLILQALERTGGNQTRAAALLGIHRDHVRYRLTKWKAQERPNKRS